MSADPVREAAQALIAEFDSRYGGLGAPIMEERVHALRAALAAPEGPAPEPVASALMDNQGELINFHSRKRDFFGAMLDDDGYIHDRDDEARADKDAAGRAPHRATLLYAAAPEAPPPVEARQPQQEPDCWAILTPNGSMLVSPDEAKGRKGAYPLYRAALAAPAGAIQPHLDHHVGAPVTPLPLDSAGGAPSATAPREHEANEHCWCEPEVDYVDPNTGAKVFVHKQTQ